jgi:hypothetical protein
MPITKADVLAVLGDPLLKRMFFSVGVITVCAEEYNNVAEYIADDDIAVVPGTKSTAFYSGFKNTIETQAGDPPLDVADRSQILHECTHAIVDINALDVERVKDEVAAYLAQLTFIVLSNPKFDFGPTVHPPVHGSPFGELMWSLFQVVRKYNLHNNKGFGAKISELDVWKLTRALHAVPDYAHIKETEKSGGDAKDILGITSGVPIKNNQMRALKAAIRLAQRNKRPRTYSPSPRLMIF